MSSVAVVYWNAKPNTEKMARLIARGAANAGAAVSIYSAEEFKPAMVAKYGAIALGCPAFDVATLKESDFESLAEGIGAKVGGNAVAVFGSYDWGVGEWLDQWEAHLARCGAEVVGNLKVAGTPEGVQEERCQALGAQLARLAARNEPELSRAV